MAGIPMPDMEALDETASLTSYAKMFRHIQGDFVTKKDLLVILATLNIAGVGKVAYVPTFLIGKSMIAVYETLVRTGKLAVKGAISAVKTAIGGL